MRQGHFVSDTADFREFNLIRCNFDTWEANFAEIKQIYYEFEKLGIPTLQASRINSYRTAFQKLKDAADKGEFLDLDLGHKMINAQVEFSQLRRIVSATQATTNNEDWRKRLNQLASGHELSAEDLKNTSARDFQFETFIGAVCKLSGYQIEFDEPDLIVADKDVRFGIAAKRPRSHKTIEKNLRKAAKQVQKSGIEGIVALDLSFALYADKCINTNDLSGSHLFVKSAVDNYVKTNFDRIKHLCREELVMGALLHLHLPVLSFEAPNESPRLATAIRWTIVPFIEDKFERFLWALDFSKRCEIGLFGKRDASNDNTIFASH